MAEIGLIASVITVVGILHKVVTQAHQYGTAVKNAKDDVQQIESELRDLGNILIKLQDFAKGAEQSGDWSKDSPTLLSLNQKGGPIAECQSSLNHLLEHLTPEEGWKKVIERAQWPRKSKQVRNALQSVILSKESILDTLKIEECGQTLEIVRTVRGLAKARNEDHHKEVMAWLTSVDPATNHHKAREMHEATTGRWFIESEDFKDWKMKESSLLWLYGIIGCGKSVLSSTIIEEMKSFCQGSFRRAMIYFYFDFGDQRKQQVHELLRSIIKQLCNQLPDLPNAVDQLHAQSKHSEPSTQDLIGVFVAIIDLFEDVYLVIDALDECSEREILFPALSDVVNHNIAKLRILITSRPEEDIKTALVPLTSGNIEIDDEKVNHDIEVYVINELARNKNLSRWNESIRKEIEVCIVGKAKGMFRWAYCQLMSLVGCKRAVALRKQLQQLPKDLDKTYELILKNIPDEDSNAAMAVLWWLTFSERPLSLEQAAEAAVMLPEDCSLDQDHKLREAEDVLEICSTLVTVFDYQLFSKHFKLVRFAHYSVKEYLVSQRILNSSVSKFGAIPEDVHTFIGKACVSYLLLFNEFDISQKHLDEFSLFSYAADYWHIHLNRGRDGEKTETAFFSQALLDRDKGYSFVNWLRVCDPDRHNSMNLSLTLGEVPSGLYYTSFLGMTESARLILEKGADINAQGGSNCNALQAASLEGHKLTAQLLLEKGADIDAQGGGNGNALHAASLNGHKLTAQLLVEKGANVNAQGGHFGNALQAACQGAKEQIVQLLLEKGASVNAQGGYFGNALQAACQVGNGQIVQLLLEKRAGINAQGGYFGNALQAACQVGNEQIVQQLLEKGAEVNAQGGIHGNALQAACQVGNEQIVQLLLEKGAEVNAQGGIHENALEAACEKGNKQIVQLLLDEGAEVNARGSYGNALRTASQRGNEQIVQLLLDKGAEVNAQEGSYGNALQAATTHQHEQIVRLLLENGADISAQAGLHGDTLQTACSKGNEQIVQLLLEKGAEVNAQGGDYGYALQAACCEGNEQIVQLLLGKGAEVNDQGGSYGNALQAACQVGNEQIVQLLLEKGAEVNAQGGIHGNALQATCEKGNKQIVQLLLEKGAQINAQGGSCGNALNAACQRENEQIIELLLERGADINARGEDCGNALQAASIYERKQITQLLLKNGADASAQGGGFHGNALQAACFKRNEHIVRLLVENGADVNNQAGHYGNALQAACHGGSYQGGNEQIVQLLLERGADVNARGGHYENALQAACQGGNEQIVQLLLKRGADINARGGCLGDALQAAYFQGHEHIAQLLVDKGAVLDVNRETSKGCPRDTPPSSPSETESRRLYQVQIHPTPDMY